VQQLRRPKSCTTNSTKTLPHNSIGGPTFVVADDSVENFVANQDAVSDLMTAGDSRAQGYSVTSPPSHSRSLEVDLELDTT